MVIIFRIFFNIIKVHVLDLRLRMTCFHSQTGPRVILNYIAFLNITYDA